MFATGLLFDPNEKIDGAGPAGVAADAPKFRLIVSAEPKLKGFAV